MVGVIETSTIFFGLAVETGFKPGLHLPFGEIPP
jgi:hypothetical protein